MEYGKLNADEKATRKQLRVGLRKCGGDVFFFPELGTSVAIYPDRNPVNGEKPGNICRFSVALGNPNDKLNRKRGELLALIRWDMGETIPARLDEYGPYNSEDLRGYAEWFADMVS